MSTFVDSPLRGFLIPVEADYLEEALSQLVSQNLSAEKRGIT